MKVLMNDTIICIILISLCVVAFYNSVSAGFTFDDHLAIDDNGDSTVHPDESLWDTRIFKNDFWGKSIFDESSHRSYRPITIFTFRMQYFLAGMKFVSWHFHLVNLIFHCIVTLQVSMFLGQVTRDFMSEVLVKDRKIGVAIGSMLFAVHPIHVEAVTPVVGRAELLSVFFGFTAFFVMTASRHSFWRISSVVSTFVFVTLLTLGVLSKDSGVVFCGLSVLYLMLRSLHRMLVSSTELRLFDVVRVMLGQLFHWRVLVPILTAFAYICFRLYIFRSVDLRGIGLFRKIEVPQLFLVHSKPAYLWYLQVKNFSLLLWPWPLCAEYSFNCIPSFPEQWWLDARLPQMIFVTMIAVIPLLAVSVKFTNYCFRRFADNLHQQEHSTVTFIGIGFLIMPYLPVSHLIIVVGTLIAERCLYLPSVGLLLLVTIFLVRQNPSSRQFSTVFFLILIFVFVFLCQQRNEDWQTDAKLFESAVRVCPNSCKNNQQLALVRFNQHRLDEGRDLLLRALEIHPEWCEPIYHLARYHFNKTNFRESLRLFRNCSMCLPMADKCYPLYKEVRNIIFPNMAYAEIANDSANIAAGMSDHLSAGNQFRQAGLAWRASNHFCLAKDAFRSSLHHRNEGGYFGLLSLPNQENEQEAKDDTYCNTKYWYAQSLMDCIPTMRVSQKRSTKVLAAKVLSEFGDLVPGGTFPPCQLKRSVDSDFEYTSKLKVMFVSFTTIASLFLDEKNANLQEIFNQVQFDGSYTASVKHRAQVELPLLFALKILTLYEDVNVMRMSDASEKFKFALQFAKVQLPQVVQLLTGIADDPLHRIDRMNRFLSTLQMLSLSVRKVIGTELDCIEAYLKAFFTSDLLGAKETMVAKLPEFKGNPLLTIRESLAKCSRNQCQYTMTACLNLAASFRERY